MPTLIGHQLSEDFKNHIKYHTLEGYNWYCSLTEQEREKERNKFAAKKYRALRKDRKRLLEDRLATLERANKKLQSENAALKQQVELLQISTGSLFC